MFEVRTLGSITVRDVSTGELLPIAQQPKCLAFLLFLALEPAPVLRCRIAALLWPEAPAPTAYAALRQVLHRIRGALGSATVCDDGRTGLRLCAGAVRCDAVTVREALASGDARAAVGAYGGDFLPGFHVSGASGFEDWSAALRTELTAGVANAAWQLACDAERLGDFAGARHWAERALLLMPYEEQRFREYLGLLQHSGEAAGALAAYYRFAERLRVELELEPSEATRQLAHDMAVGGSPQAFPERLKRLRRAR